MRTRTVLLPAGILLTLLAALPTPHPEARLFSDGWGATQFIDPDFCVTTLPGQPPRLALGEHPAAVATPLDRLALAAGYLAWGVLLPVLALRAVLRPEFGRQRPAAMLVGLLGVAPALFHWTRNPAFARFQQELAEVWLTIAPLDETLLPGLDSLALALVLLAGAMLPGTASLLAVRAAARLAAVDWRELALHLRPLAAVTVFLGLTQSTALYLRGEGVPLEALPALRAALLALGVYASGRRGLRAIGHAPAVPGHRAAAGLLWLVPLALAVLHIAALFAHGPGRYHV